MTPDSGRDVAVVGAGVIGLTTAVQLAEAGWNVHVLTKDLPMRTTSAAAGAIWAAPYLVRSHGVLQGGHRLVA
jgi:D-amino-acid oxidase